jgi:hypothetical protein
MPSFTAWMIAWAQSGVRNQPGAAAADRHGAGGRAAHVDVDAVEAQFAEHDRHLR